jgi:hypothetical protein
MSAPDNHETIDTQVPGQRTFGEKMASVIDDPFGSVIAGIVAPTIAVGFVISGILGLGLVY